MNLRLLVSMSFISLLTGAGLVYYKFPRIVQLPPEVKTETVTKTVTKVVTKIVKPDGTVIETVTEKEAEKTATEQTHAPLPVPPGWSLGLAYRPDLSKVLEHQWDAWELNAARRLVGPTWLTLQVNPLRKEMGLGVSYEF